LLLHGTPLTPEVWEPVAERLGRDTGTRVHVPSITPAPGERAVNESLVSRVVGGLGADERVHVVGHSFGGQIAMDLVARIGPRARSLTLLCTRDTPFPAFEQSARAIREHGVPDPAASLSRWFTPAELRDDGPVVRYAARVLAEADPESYALALESIAGYVGPASLPQLPISAVAAELDPVSSPDVMREMAGRLPGCRFTMLPHAAHMSPFTDPDALARILAAGRTGEG
jgi:pimeloyl-ACP methyl ester carboxylesterase